MDRSKYEWSLGSCILEGPHFQLFSPEAILFGIIMAIKNNFSKFPPDNYQGCADLLHVRHKHDSLLFLKDSKKVGFG